MARRLNRDQVRHREQRNLHLHADVEVYQADDSSNYCGLITTRPSNSTRIYIPSGASSSPFWVHIPTEPRFSELGNYTTEGRMGAFMSPSSSMCSASTATPKTLPPGVRFFPHCLDSDSVFQLTIQLLLVP